MAILRKPPTQERSRQTVDVILKDAAQVLEKRGESALMTTSVAERAGVFIGNLYQYFSGRDAILLAIASHEHDLDGLSHDQALSSDRYGEFR
jgi:AcrR family transcriptional regulator